MGFGFAIPIAADPAASAVGGPGMGMDPSAMAAMQAQAQPDPVDAFFGDLFGDAEPDMAAADPSFLAARGGGPGMEGLPVVAGPNGQAMLMTGQGALPLFMTEQGPMAMTPGGAPVPLAALARGGMGGMDMAALQQQQALRQGADLGPDLAILQKRQALAAAVAERQAMAQQPKASSSPYSGQSSFIPAKRAPVSLTASAPQAAPVTPAKEKTAPVINRPVADPKLDQKAGIGTRIGTTGTGDGNLN